MKDSMVLLVEDSQHDEELIIRALGKSKVVNDVVIMRDGAEALDYIFATGAHIGRNVAHQPAVVLLDLKLPKVDGLEVLRRIRADERTRLLPVVILTSSNQERDIVAGYASGANSFVRKPIEFAEFSDAIGRVGMYWLIVNEPPPVGDRHSPVEE